MTQDVLKTKLKVAYLDPQHFAGQKPAMEPTMLIAMRLGNAAFPSSQEEQTKWGTHQTIGIKKIIKEIKNGSLPEDGHQIGGSWIYLLLLPNLDTWLIFQQINWTFNEVLANIKFGSQGVQRSLHNGYIKDLVGFVTPSLPARRENPPRMSQK